MQNDEALFAGPLFHDHPREYTMRAFKHDIPLMLLSYLGTTKTWLYWGIFRIFHSGIWQLRLPVIMIGAVTLAVLFLLFRRAAGIVAATSGCLLLAVDPLYVFATTFDWGPVAIQHLTFACAVLLFARAATTGSTAAAGFAGVAAGIGMWDKALFVWMASGAVIGTLILYRRKLRAFCRVRVVGALVLGFTIGSLPLIVYNARHPFNTFRGNFQYAPGELPRKAKFLKWCLSGAGLDGYIPGEEWRDHPRLPRTVLERASVAVRNAVGERRTTGFFWMFCAAALTTPLWPRQRRAMLFALITIGIAWLQMALNRETGGGVHHVVLLWPAPQFVVGAAIGGLAHRLAESRPRLRVAIPATVLTICFCGNLLGLNQYFSQFVRMGSVGGWTDAIFPLADYLARNAQGPVFAADWGMTDALVLLHEGKRIYGTAEDVLTRDSEDPERRRILTWMLEQPGVLFLTHTPGNEFNPGNADRLSVAMRALGYAETVQAVINDSHGRAIFNVVRFAAGSSGPSTGLP